MANLIIKFVVQSNHEDSPDMIRAFDQSKLQYNLNPEWITIDECLQLEKIKLLKTDVFVFEEFSGPAFDHISGSKALVIGTRCLLYCLSQSEELPPSKYPLYTLAMVGLNITSSGLQPNQKEQITKFIQWMGGVYDKELHVKTTHLISNNVNSIKYSRAAGKLPIMRYEWVEAIWKESLKDTLVGDCADFFQNSLETYRLLPFHGLNITSASLSPTEREKIKNFIENNGGVYMGRFMSDKTDILVVDQNGINSAKYKAAYQFKKEIVMPSWIFESCEKGYAVPMDEHRLLVPKVSTPTKENVDIDLTSNFSMMSAIGTDKPLSSVVEETIDTTISKHITMVPLYTPALSQTGTSDIKLLFNMKTVREAGLFLDGCGIYIAGFSTEDREFLYRIINSGGATRYDGASERVSHVILSNANFDVQSFKSKNLSPFFVNIGWLVESVRSKQVVNEDDFIVKFSEDGDRKTLKSNYDEKRLNMSYSPRSERLEDIEHQLKVMQMYKNNSTSNSTTAMSTDFSRSSTRFHYFFDRAFYISKNLADSQKLELQALIADAGGTIAKQVNDANYMIVPEKLAEKIEEPHDSCQIIISLFIKSCIAEQSEVNVEYYHKPIIISEKKPLSDLVFSISSYSGPERYYIAELSRELGALCMDKFVRKSKPQTGVKGATHLICKEDKGEKYKACVLWGLPAVKVEWLLECYKTQTRVAENQYLVGETRAPIVQDVQVQNDDLTLVFNDETNTRTLEFKNPDEKSNQNTPHSHLNRNEPQVDENLFHNLEQNSDDKLEERRQIINEMENIGDNRSDCSQTTPPGEKSNQNTPRTHLKQNESRIDENLFQNVESIGLDNSPACRQTTPPDDKSNQNTPRKHLKQNEPQIDENLFQNFEQNSDDEFEEQRRIINKRLKNLHENRSPCSQTTPPPLSKILKRIENRTSETPESPFPIQLPEYLRTPDTPYGAFIYDDPTPNTRKRWKRWCDSLPSPASPITPKSPPLTWSGVKRELVAALMKPQEETNSAAARLNFDDTLNENTKLQQESPMEQEEPSPKEQMPAVNTQLEELKDRLGSLSKITPTRALTPVSEKQLLHNFHAIHYGVAQKESQVESVGWRDPSELSPSCRSSSIDVEFDEMQPFRKRPPVFLLSGVLNKAEITKIILDLGGEICNEYNPTCSHILCDQPSRSEKILAGISSGKWILSTDYISHCLTERRFTAEEHFEWGNPKGQYCSSNMIQEAQAYYRWRCKLNNSPEENISDGAFKGWKVVLQLEKKASFSRVIKAGFGEIVESEDLELLQEGSVTHCFCEPRKNPLSDDEICYLTRIGAQVLPVQYLNKYLLEDPTPDCKSYLITV